MELFAYLEASARQLTRRSANAASQDVSGQTQPADQQQATAQENGPAAKADQTPKPQGRWQDDGMATTWWV